MLILQYLPRVRCFPPTVKPDKVTNMRSNKNLILSRPPQLFRIRNAFRISTSVFDKVDIMRVGIQIAKASF